MDDHRSDVLDVLSAGLTAVDGQRCVIRALSRKAFKYDIYLIAIGKAAAAMTNGALACLGRQITNGLVVTKPGHVGGALRRFEQLTVIEAGHPVPDGNSLRAGEVMLRLLDHAPRNAELLFLVSGGASSLIEMPWNGVSLDDLVRVNKWLLSSGLDIRHMNAVRKGLSRIKGGRLASWLKGRSTTLLLISDVPGDRISDIGSGLLVPAATSDLDLDSVPGWLQKLLARGKPAPRPGDRAFASIGIEVIATNQDARRAAAARAVSKGYNTFEHAALVQGSAVESGRSLAKRLLASAPGMHVWGGETTVCLPASPGRGGRNQSLALAAASELAGVNNVYFLSVGSDGSDGPSDKAGALVDGGTISRGEQAGFSTDKSLRDADAGSFLDASGDLVTTGPTGTNVMDLMLGLKGRGK